MPISVVSAGGPNHEAAINRAPFTIPFAIPTYWTPEQALAVVELLDDLRDQIWEHYDLQLHQLITGEVYQPSRADDPDAVLEDRLF